MSELPEGWQASTVGECFLEIKNGTTATQNKLASGITVSRIETIQNNKFDLNRVQHIESPSHELVEAYKYQEGDIAFSHINSFEHVGKTALYEGKPETLIHGMNLLRLRRGHEYIYPKFAHYFMLSNFFRDEVRKRVGHAVNQVSINQKNLSEVPFVLAPLDEQRRIVAKLEKLLSRVDGAQARLATIPRILKRFRQSVLAAACSGRLTADWREQLVERSCDPIDLQRLDEERRTIIAKIYEQKDAKRFTCKPSVKIDIGNKSKGIDELFELPSSWQWVSLGQVTWDVADGPHFSPKYVDKHSGVPFISGRNISYNGIDFSDAKYVSRGDHAEFIKRAKPMRRDVLLTKGGTTGIATIVDTDEAFSIWVHVALLKVIEKFVSPYYLRDVLSSSFVYKQSQEQTHGVGNQDLGLTRMVYMALPLPPLAEQQEIVRRVEALFKTADALEARYRTAKAHVDKLTQSILAKAFRGEFVPQDPNDEPASVLIERLNQSALHSNYKRSRTTSCEAKVEATARRKN
jgi:type I restriction enzyme S subunit